MQEPASTVIADARPGNWVDTLAPRAIRPYLKLARLDRPIGTWLLLWPCLWSITLATAADPLTLWPDWRLFVLFAIGAIAMRGAGCTYNDIVDRDFDAKVERTRLRPIPSGQVSVKQAWAFLGTQCLIGLLVLLTLPETAILLGVLSLALVAAYPFMKRITYWPQAWLGLTFNWGALMGWAAHVDGLMLPAFLLYGAGIAWTLGYDTIYAHQDKEDDALIGVKSTALRLGAATKGWLKLFYGAMLAFLATAGLVAGANPLFLLGLAFVALHLGWQVRALAVDDSASCLRIFKSNREAGALVFASFALGLI